MPLSHRPLHRHRRCNHHELRCPYHLAENHGIVMSTAGSNYFVRVLSTLDREKLKPNASVALHRHSHSVVDILPPEADSTIQVGSELTTRQTLEPTTSHPKTTKLTTLPLRRDRSW